ncbi:hypothetical protein RB623_06185 [Mesorhizobium sp. LHD-90]|uniref:hypothetical protein n=1 Tax=Mesorhizobium sp. LHD-90 TaxID=3071414 RepID=UPI0027DFE0D1|nr:hypothetical protein [Mesorhizobium sp. LHD-90]MDQ6433637.1 hypothetical protein [Mesorhizobium sp. LHD-90]
MQDVAHYAQLADIMETYDFPWFGFDLLLHKLVAKSDDLSAVPAYTTCHEAAGGLISMALPGWKHRFFLLDKEEILPIPSPGRIANRLLLAWYSSDDFDPDECEYIEVHVDGDSMWTVAMLKGMLLLLDRLDCQEPVTA